MNSHSEREPPVEVRIESLAGGGRGVARVAGRVWFVPGGLPGDVWTVVARRDRGRYVEAMALELRVPSPDRRRPPCPIQPRCGGCPWMPLVESAQRRWKRQLVQDALDRVGGLATPVQAVEPAPEPLGYRGRVEFRVGLGAAGEPWIGLHGSRPGTHVDVSSCAMQHGEANVVLGLLRRELTRDAAALGAWVATGEPPRITIRRAWHSGELLVALRDTGRLLPGARRLARDLLGAHPALVGVVRVKAVRGRRGRARVETLAGRDWLSERVAGIDFRLPATVFVQVNPALAQQLVRHVVEQAGALEDARLLDLYAGVGVHGLSLARRARTGAVTLVEADARAVACAREAARELGLEVEAVPGDVRRFLEGAAREERRADVVVANPPRTGLGRGVATGIARLAPRRIVMVSCDPATLARDLRALVEAGYRVERVQPLDQFPQTAHVETVASLRRTAAS